MGPTIGHVPFDLDRFVAAQEGVYDGVVREIRAGRKTTHWIWFIFPQLAGLGRSDVSLGRLLADERHRAFPRLARRSLVVVRIVAL